MSLARIEIEEHRPGFWVAEVEAGYPACRRERVTGGTIVEIVSKVGDAYERMMGRPAAVPEIAAGEVGYPAPAVSIRHSEPPSVPSILGISPRLDAMPASQSAYERLAHPVEKRAGWKVPRAPADLVAQARAIGIPAKGTWTRARVLREVAKVAEGKA